MDKGHKKYILDNMGRKSVREMALELGLKERKIKKIIEQGRRDHIAARAVKTAKAPTGRKAVWLAALLIIILGVTIYANSIYGEFVWDDNFLIEKNTYIESFSYIPQAFTGHLFAGAMRKSTSFYRPIQTLTYMLDYFLWGYDQYGYHITNILLHVLASLLVFYLVMLLFGDKLLSLLTGLLFLVHPLHTEAVAYISGRADSLALVFALLCFIFYLKQSSRSNITGYVLMLLSCVFALLSKESSLILPFLLLLYSYAFRKKIVWKNFISILAVIAVYVILRMTVLKFASSRPDVSTLSERLPGCFVAIASYIKLLFLPFNLHMEYGTLFFNMLNPWAIVGLIATIVLIAFAFAGRKRSGLVCFSILWFYIILLPVSGIYPINAYMAEHWLYMPSIGFFLLMASVIRYLYRIEKFKKSVIVLTAALVVFYSYLTVRQNSYWRDPVHFYKRTLEFAPDSARVLINLGTFSDLEEAVNLYKKAIEANDGLYTPAAYYNLGNSYTKMKRYDEAIAAYKKAVELDPEHEDAHNNMGNVYLYMGRKEEAIAEYKKVIVLNPGVASSYNNLGKIYLDMGSNEEAIELFKKALKINPDFAMAHNNLAVAYFYEKQYDLAIKHCDMAVNLGYEVHPGFLESLKPYRK